MSFKAGEPTVPWAIFGGNEIRYASESVLISDKNAGTANLLAYRELLVRPTKDGSRIRPDIFIGEMERTPAKILEFDLKTFDFAMYRLAQEPAARFGINVSGTTISDPHFTNHVGDALGKTPDNARRLIVEITETAPIIDTDQAVRFTRMFQGLGGFVALDDLGAEGRGDHMTLPFIRALKPRVLKIDNERLKDLGVTTRLTLLQSLIDLGRHMGSRTVVEGVSDHATARRLIDANASMLQIYTKPVAPGRRSFMTMPQNYVSPQASMPPAPA